jgi:hypothetical protein
MNGGSGPLKIVRLGGLALAGAAALAGCADFRRSLSPPPVNPESPVAAQVRAGAPLDYETPRLQDVPPVPRNVPQAPVVKGDVLGMIRCRRGVASYAVTHPQLTHGAEQFADTAREIAEVNPADVPPPDSAARSEAAAQQLRAYAAPPAALASGPAPTPAEAQPNPPAAPHPGPAPSRRGSAPSRTAQAPAPVSHAAPAAGPPSAAAAAVGAAPVQAADAAPPLPPPGPDPLLAHCT